MLACAKLTGLIQNGTNLKAKMTNGADYDLEYSVGTRVLLRGVQSSHKRHSGQLLQ